MDANYVKKLKEGVMKISMGDIGTISKGTRATLRCSHVAGSSLGSRLGNRGLE